MGYSESNKRKNTQIQQYPNKQKNLHSDIDNNDIILDDNNIQTVYNQISQQPIVINRNLLASLAQF